MSNEDTKKADSKAKSGGKAAAGKAGASKKAAPATPATKPSGAPRTPTLLARYRKDVIGELMKEFSYSNVNEVPQVKKITLNFGVGSEATSDPNVVKQAVSELTDLSGQRAVATKAKKAIANFKLRAGQPIGAMVTLRGARMWDFLLRLLNLALPRTRDFKGVSNKAFDGRGDYTLGLKEQSIFAELPYEKTPKIRGLNVTISTSATSDAEGLALLKHLGMPFRQEAARS